MVRVSIHVPQGILVENRQKKKKTLQNLILQEGGMHVNAGVKI